ncbi:MAG: hypothetical protein BWY75_03776 [bacterium ADurb.Bin425]|nr:MAG: hypothetical protein BWY75_03776 [bacterium ADurb.Bin425]
MGQFENYAETPISEGEKDDIAVLGEITGHFITLDITGNIGGTEEFFVLSPFKTKAESLTGAGMGTVTTG